MPDDVLPPVVDVADPRSDEASVVLRIGTPHAGTLIAFAGLRRGFFGGLDGALRSPRPRRAIELSGALGAFPGSVLFVRDRADFWFQTGIDGLGGTPEEAAKTLSGLIPASSHLRGTMGASAGGMAAILFGALMGAPKALAFSPRTLLTPAEASEAAAARGQPAPSLDPMSSDLRRVLRTCPMLVDIHVGARNLHDREQARRLRHLRTVTIAEHDTDMHMCARWLRDRGELTGIIARSFGFPLGHDRAGPQTPTT